MSDEDTQQSSRDIYTYDAPWPLYATGWSCRPDRPFRLVTCGYSEEAVSKGRVVQLSRSRDALEATAEFDMPFPATKAMWHPSKSSALDLFATSGDSLRVWEVNTTGQVGLKVNLSNSSKQSEFCGPLTSFDWNETNPDIIGTASIDKTCTIWSVENHKVKTQLIAHDKEVYDIAFQYQSTEVFASVGADGSLRMFDLRSLEHSTIMYENSNLSPLLRLSWNRQDPFLLATFSLEANKVIILDIRSPSVAAAELYGHIGFVNAVTWAPHSSRLICTGAEDRLALVWDLCSLPKPVDCPSRQYEAEGEINHLTWSFQPEWIAAAVGNKLLALHV
ncbi:WD40 repeat protein [Pelomyxa schiedti]|nr:WD40 repeat protein [Pelomyxa schiedti]